MPMHLPYSIELKSPCLDRQLIAGHLDGDRIETATLYELTDLGRSTRRASRSDGGVGRPELAGG